MDQTTIAEPLRVPSPARTEERGPSFAVALRATLAYHDLLDLPLTAVECWRYLLRPRTGGGELSAISSSPGEATAKSGQLSGTSLRESEEVLRELVAARQLETRHGFYFFPGRERLVEERIVKQARSQEKWRRLRRIVFFLQAVPFLRGVAGTGSLAFENAKPTSDLDVLVIAASNRVWTVRFLLTVLLDAFRLRRRPRSLTTDRICLNHYLSEDALVFPYRSLYTAMEYARLVPLLGEETCRAFRAANRPWMEEFLTQVFPDTLRHQKTLRMSRVLLGLQRLGESFLTGPLGDALEGLLARLQRVRIVRGESAGSPGRVVATAARAEFHPHSREAPLLRAFNERMEALGLQSLFGSQRDSGLTV